MLSLRQAKAIPYLIANIAPVKPPVFIGLARRKRYLRNAPVDEHDANEHEAENEAEAEDQSVTHRIFAYQCKHGRSKLSEDEPDGIDYQRRQKERRDVANPENRNGVQILLINNDHEYDEEHDFSHPSEKVHDLKTKIRLHRQNEYGHEEA